MSNTLHNAIMEAGSKDRPLMLAPGIDNDIYSTVDACPNACEMWKAIKRLKQGEYINVQDLETNLYWEFRKFTSQDGESLESYYSRFVTLVKQSQELKTISYHKLYDILKQHQHEVNEIKAERIARIANPLVLVAQQQPGYHPPNHPTHYTQNSSTTSQQAATRNKGKAIFNSPQPIYDQEPSMVAADDETSKDKEIDKLMALISLSFKKIYKPTNNNLRTSSNTSRVNQDNSLRIYRKCWDGESLESYYSKFYKMMNELIRNQCNVTNHHVNVQFLLQLQPEWQRFVTLVKQNQELKTVSYHELYDILKQHQHEVNEIRAERIAHVANLLALVAQQQPVYNLQNHPTHYNQNSSTRSQQVATRNREKAIVNSPQPIYDQEPSMVTDDDETSKDKGIDRLMALISLSFKKIYKPTNNNLRTSSNTSRANQDNSPRINRGTGHVARECQKPKRAKDAAYHRKKMLLCKQEEAGIQLNAEQADW
nr:hypothetical protein [Tanacetum cinerariifolium]